MKRSTERRSGRKASRSATPHETDRPCLTYRTSSAVETARLGEVLGSLVRAGDLILLKGQYGSGKTTFTQGLARGMGIVDAVTSPSFTLVNEYRPAADGVGPPLFHLDLYRISSAAEALDLGLDDYLAEGAVVVVEWPERAGEALSHDHLDVYLDYADRPGDDERRITFCPVGDRPRALLEALRQSGQQVPLAGAPAARGEADGL